jgi:hypothetical protein
MSPFAPHVGEEVWSRLGHPESLAYQPWPTFDEALCEDDVIKLGVQVRGPTLPPLPGGLKGGPGMQLHAALRQ